MVSAARHHMSMDDAIEAPNYSCWERFTSCCRKTPSYASRIESISPLMEATPTSCCDTFLNKTLRVIRFPFDKLHTPIGAGLLSVAAGVGLIMNATLFPNTYLATTSALLLGYFGQTVASQFSSTASTSGAQRLALYANRLQQHTSLATMMITGFLQSGMCVDTTNCAPIIINCVLGGMLARLKIQKKDELEEISQELAISDLEEIAVDPVAPLPVPAVVLAIPPLGALPAPIAVPAPVEGTLTPYVNAIKNNPLLVIGATSATCFAFSVLNMGLSNQITVPRMLNLSILLAEYGLKGVGGALGYKVAQVLNANKENAVCKKISKTIGKIEGLGIGLSLYGHQILPTNINAAAVMLPIGFLLGSSIFRMVKVSKLEDVILEIEAKKYGPVPPPPLCTRSSVIAHVATTTLFEAVGCYLWLKGPPQMLGYEMFFTAVPIFYGITRFGFSKVHTHHSLPRKFGHFIFQKSPQLIAEELNYGVSFLHAGLIAKTVSNARIYFLAQAALFATIEASLFALDAAEDAEKQRAELEEVSPETSHRLKVIRTIKNTTTRNHARMDMILYILLNTYFR